MMKSSFPRQKQQPDIQPSQEYETTQNYVSTLFESLPRIDFEQSAGSELIKSLMNQNHLYGKKIIELSEKFTSFYRKDNIIDRKEVQEKIVKIYELVFGEEYRKEIQVDEMLNIVLKRLKAEYSNVIKAASQRERQLQESIVSKNAQIQNILANQKLIESKIQMKSSMKDSKSMANENLYLNELQANGQESIMGSRKQSMQQSKSKSVARSSKKKEKNLLEEEQIPLKKVLKIKNLMEQQQVSIKKVLQKLTTKIQQLNISKLNIPQQKLTYTKPQDQTNRQNLQSLLQAIISNHQHNLSNVGKLLELIFASIDRKFAQELQSESKFTLYTKEIERREQVFFYAVSKMIGQVNQVKGNVIKGRYEDCMGILDDLLAVGEKFYDLYPSNSIIKDLKVSNVGTSANSNNNKSFPTIQYSNYAIQVNTIKPQRPTSTTKSSISQSVRYSQQFQLEMFKFETKLNELFEKFEKTQLKFKKTVEVKEITRLLASVRELVPDRSKSSLGEGEKKEMARFQEEYGRVVGECREKEEKLREEFNRRERKLQKQIKQLQHLLELCQSQKHRESANHSQQLSKLTKKLQSLQQKHKLSIHSNQSSEATIKQFTQQLTKLKDHYRQQQLKYEHKFSQLQKQLISSQQQIAKKQSQVTEMLQQQQEKNKQRLDEILLYKKKIVLLEERNDTLVKDNEQLKGKLEAVSVSAEFSKDKLAEMTQVYEQKIREVDDMIEAISQLKKILELKDHRILELENQTTQQTKTITQCQNIIEAKDSIISKLKQQLERQQTQKQSIIQNGQLNESDVTKLKEQFTKVHQAYQESEDELQSLRQVYEELQRESTKMQEENNRLREKVEELKARSAQTERYEIQCKSLRQQNEQFQQQVSQLSNKLQYLQNQLYLIKKQSKQLKSEQLQQSKQLRQLRQQVQKLKEEQSLLKGKSKIQLQTTKIQLRKKNSENVKIKEHYEQKLQLLEGKYKELQKFISQKQLLAKISNNHLTQ